MIKPRDYLSPKGAVTRLYDQVGGVGEVERILMIGRSLAYAFTDPREAEREISFARVVALSGPGRDAAAAYLAGVCGGVFVPLAAGDAVLHLATADAARETGEALAQVVTALADGEMTRLEAVAATRELDQALAALGALRAQCEAVAVRGEQVRP